MANNEICDALLKILNRSRGHPLTVYELAELMRRREFFTDISFSKAAAKINSALCFQRNNARYPFIEFQIHDETRWGLSTWLPAKRPFGRKTPQPKKGVAIGTEMQFTISDEQAKKIGLFPVQHERFQELLASMNDTQRETNSVPLQCYGSEIIICYLDVHAEAIRGDGLAQWYRENHLHVGNIVRLSVQKVRPLVLRLYTEWERDADAFRRHAQRQQLPILPHTDLCIRDIIYLYLTHRQEIAHRTEIEEHVLEMRPEVSVHSIGGSLAANDYIFVRTGERGFWALREWNITPVQIVEPQSGTDPLAPVRTIHQPRQVDLDYVLANIQSEDLAYRILRATNCPMKYTEICERIAVYFMLDKSIMQRTSFLNRDDPRILQLQDGTFMLQDRADKVIAMLTTQNQQLRARLEDKAETFETQRKQLETDLVTAIEQYQAALLEFDTQLAAKDNCISQLQNEIESVRQKNEDLSKQLTLCANMV